MTSKFPYSPIYCRSKEDKAYPLIDPEQRKLFVTLKAIFKNYTVKNFTKFLEFEEAQTVIRIFDSSWVVDKVLNASLKTEQDKNLTKEVFQDMVKKINEEC